MQLARLVASNQGYCCTCVGPELPEAAPSCTWPCLTSTAPCYGTLHSSQYPCPYPIVLILYSIVTTRRYHGRQIRGAFLPHALPCNPAQGPTHLHPPPVKPTPQAQHRLHPVPYPDATVYSTGAQDLSPSDTCTRPGPSTHPIQAGNGMECGAELWVDVGVQLHIPNPCICLIRTGIPGPTHSALDYVHLAIDASGSLGHTRNLLWSSPKPRGRCTRGTQPCTPASARA